MAVTISGTDGITTPDIDTDGLSVDTNAIFVDPATKNVGIGTSSPSVRLQTNATINTAYSASNTLAGGVIALIKNASATNSTDATIRLETTGSASLAVSSISAVHIGDGASALTFGTRTNAASGVNEKLRIDANGNLLVGTTTANGVITAFNGGGGNCMAAVNAGSGTQTAIVFRQGNPPAFVGSITMAGGSSTAYNTSSDYRLKEDAQPVQNPIDRLMQLKPINFAWKVDGSRVDGFLAHEAQEVVPDAVTGTKDAVETVDVTDKEGKVIGTEVKPVHQGIDQSKLVPLLTAAIQEQQTLIQALTARIEALEQEA